MKIIFIYIFIYLIINSCNETKKMKSVVVHYKCNNCVIQNYFKCYQDGNENEVGKVVQIKNVNGDYYFTIMIEEKILLNKSSIILIKDGILRNTTEFIFPKNIKTEKNISTDTLEAKKKNISTIILEENDSLRNEMKKNKLFKIIDTLISNSRSGR